MSAPQELALAGKKAKFQSIEDIMKDPAKRALLTSMADEAVQAKRAIEKQQIIIKGFRDAAFEQLGLKPALFNNYVSLLFNNDYQDRKDGLEQQLTLVELVMGLAGGPNPVKLTKD